MASSFLSALSGLRANQSWIDLIGNNLANSNTTGFKTSRALFADLLSRTFKPATPAIGSIGGTNPLQVGLGVQLASTDRLFSQGALNATGRTFDLALLGQGFFGLATGTETLYSRAGAFGLDENGTLVDLRSGYRVLGAGGAPVQIDTTSIFPPSATTQVSYSGNLPAVVTGPLAEELTSSTSFLEGTAAELTGTATGPFVVPANETWTMELVVNGGAPQQVAIAGTGAALTAQDVVNEINAQTEDVVASVGGGGEIVLTSERSGASSTVQVNAGTSGMDLKGLLGLGDFVQGTETTATLATDLGDLTINLSDYQNGDVIDVSGTDADGTPVVAAFVYGTDGTTVGDLVAFIDAQYAGSTAAFNPTTGEITVTADTTGEADLSLSIDDAPGQAGAADWESAFFSVTSNGTGPDTATTSIEIFDGAGTSHVLTGVYERQDDSSWTLTFSVPSGDGTVTSAPITGIMFNPDGSLNSPSGGQVQIAFTNGGNLTVGLDLGTPGQFGGLTQFGSPTSVVAEDQDGFGAGELSGMEVAKDGTINGFYTNGQTQDLGSVGVATFVNPGGLEEVGDSYFRVTANSGNRTFGAADQSGAGEIVGGAIEGSNVDTAEEFVNLIQAQRAYQANARVVTVQDQILSDTVNLI